jgi:hypothetical protein
VGLNKKPAQLKAALVKNKTGRKSRFIVHYRRRDRYDDDYHRREWVKRNIGCCHMSS